MSKANAGQMVSIAHPMGNEGGVIGIDYVHEQVHVGRTFQSSYKSPEGADVADNVAINLQITTGALRECHFVFEVNAGGDTELEFYEGVTSSVGTAVYAHNMNRLEGTMTPECAVVHTPTVTNTGQRLHNSVLPGGTGVGSGATPGGTARAGSEWILKKSTKYLIRATNRSAAAQPMSATLQWYEIE